MPGFDDRLKQHLERLAPPADPSGAFDRVLEKKIKRRLMRRFQAAGLALAVIAATIGGTFALVRTFDSEDAEDRLGDIRPTPVQVSNGLIAYASMESGNWDIWTAMPDGTRAGNLTAESLANETDPAWSPDGTKIAFVSDRAGNPDIYVMSALGATVTHLTKDPAGEYAPTWSPDGVNISYVSGECTLEDCSTSAIFVMRADGSEAQQLTFGAGADVSPAWAPDGSMIAFALSRPPPTGPSPGPKTDRGIYVIRPDGSGQRRVTRSEDPSLGQDLWPDWSPDGSSIVFARAGDIYVMRRDGSGVKKLTDSEEGNSPSARPSWSPDETKIVFERIPAGESTPEIHIMNADGSDLTPTGLTGGGAEVLAPDWQAIPAATLPSVAPTVEPTPTISPLPPGCEATQVTGNFDGDGEPDTATVAKTDCLIDPGDQGDRFSTEYALHVRWPPSEGIAPLPDCRKACQALAAADLNGDGIDEFILLIDKGASTDFFRVYELPASEAFGSPALVAPPGGKRFPPGETGEFALFGSVTHYDAFGCDLMNNQVIVQSAGLNSERMEWSVHETILRFDPVEEKPFGQFTVISERDYTEPAEENVGPGDQFEPGDPCWIYSG